MSDENLKAELARKALAICVDRIDKASPVALPAILESTRKQLEWLVAYFEGRSTQREKLKTLVFGHYAAREMDERDDEFVQALYMAAYVADQTARGLKLDKKVLRGIAKNCD